jgi:hypothetical protein
MLFDAVVVLMTNYYSKRAISSLPWRSSGGYRPFAAIESTCLWAVS